MNNYVIMKNCLKLFAAVLLCLLPVTSCQNNNPISGPLVMEYEEIPSMAIQNCELTLADKSGASTVLEGVAVIIEVKNRTAVTTVYDRFNNEMMKFTDTDTSLYLGNLTGEGYKELMCLILAHTSSFSTPTEFKEEDIVARITPKGQTAWTMYYVRQFTQI